MLSTELSIILTLSSLNLYIVHLISVPWNSTELVVLLVAWESCRDGAWVLCLMNTSALRLPKQEFLIRGLWSSLMCLASSIFLYHFHVQRGNGQSTLCSELPFFWMPKWINWKRQWFLKCIKKAMIYFLKEANKKHNWYCLEVP